MSPRLWLEGAQPEAPATVGSCSHQCRSHRSLQRGLTAPESEKQQSLLASWASTFPFNLEVLFLNQPRKNVASGCFPKMAVMVFISHSRQLPDTKCIAGGGNQGSQTSSLTTPTNFLSSFYPITCCKMPSLKVIRLSCLVPAQVITERFSLLRVVELLTADTSQIKVPLLGP